MLLLQCYGTIEIASALSKRKVQRAELAESALLFAFELIAELEIVTDSVAWMSADLITNSMRNHKLTAYDATYLELAIRRSLPLATFDKEPLRAAPLAGVPVLAD